MGIHGLLKHLGQGERISLARFSAQHYTSHNRPLRLAVDISIWLFQIQSGKGGSNPALRTFYYRLLRLLSLNIHPLFVFDGPNKPLFKRNKKVGGPGVKVATVPEFLAKQLLKEFGFPWHVAPGEAEAECALFQRHMVVDAVLSEDVDTLMFGSGVTLRNWSQEGTAKGNKTPSHVNVYRTEETTERSGGIDKEGMILVALMSGGDYIPEGVPGIGPKVACDAARAGFGKELCALHRKDSVGMKEWKGRLETEIRTNVSKFFSRKNTGFVIPDDFPNREVLGYYTHPCVSTPEKVERLRREVKWEQEIDFAALRNFAGDAFDWRCRGGAKKFIKNIAPAMLMRELRLKCNASTADEGDQEIQEAKERELVHAIHGKRNHTSVDNELEYRITFTPSSLVPIDLSLEEEDDDFIPAGGATADDSDAESELFPGTQLAQDDTNSEAPSETPVSPKKRQFRPYDPDQPEKLWILRPFLRAGCPLLVEDYEASTQDPREFLKQRRNAKAASRKDANVQAPASKQRKKTVVESTRMRENALTSYARITKAGTSGPLSDNDRTMKELSPRANARLQSAQSKPREKPGLEHDDFEAIAVFKLPSTQIPASFFQENDVSAHQSKEIEVLDLAASSPSRTTSKFPAGIDPLRPFAAFAAARPRATNIRERPSSQAAGGASGSQRTPKRTSRKRPSPELSSPALSQKTITSYYSPSPQKLIRNIPLSTQRGDVVDLISSSPAPIPNVEDDIDRPVTPTLRARTKALRRSASPTPRRGSNDIDESARLPDTVTKRRRKEPLRRWRTEPIGIGMSVAECDPTLPTPEPRVTSDEDGQAEVTIVIPSSPAQSDDGLVSPSMFVPAASQTQNQAGGGSQRPLSRSETSLTRNQPVEETCEDRFSGEGGFLREEFDNQEASAYLDRPPASSYPTPPSIHEATDDELPPVRIMACPTPKKIDSTAASKPRTSKPKAAKNVKTRIILRESLEGSWKEVSVDVNAQAQTEMLDMTGDGSGWKKSGGRAEIWSGWRKSGVEVLDLTGA